jgi:streptogramin lyase
MSISMRAHLSSRQVGMRPVLGLHRVLSSEARVVAGPKPKRHRPLIRRLAGLTAVAVGVPVLTLGLTTGTASASGAGQVTIYAATSRPVGITAGPGGALWFTDQENSSIGRITISGTVKTFTGIGIGSPQEIALGPDGALWFTNYGSNSIGRITTAGVVTNYTGPRISYPVGIAAGPDGALWFSNSHNNSIGRITAAGVVTNYTGTGISEPLGISLLRWNPSRTSAFRPLQGRDRIHEGSSCELAAGSLGRSAERTFAE